LRLKKVESPKIADVIINAMRAKGIQSFDDLARVAGRKVERTYNVGKALDCNGYIVEES
jgi:hypothetical protein